MEERHRNGREVHRDVNAAGRLVRSIIIISFLLQSKGTQLNSK
jgi:hypothetical protein